MPTFLLSMRQNLSTRFRPSIFGAAFVVAALLLSLSAVAERNQQDEQPPFRNPRQSVEQRVADLSADDA
jgi:hypothetical protein